MTSIKIKDLLKAQPFRPFEMRLTDGQRFVINHPEFAAVSPSGRTVVVFEPGDEDEHFRVLDILLITTLEPLRQKPNGKPRRK
jgi:hypothetical protein